MRLSPEDAKQHGYTNDCPGCVSLRDRTSVCAWRNHTQACRDRMEEVIGGERVRRAAARCERELDERIQQEDARIAAGGAPPSQDAARAPSTPRLRATSDVAEDGQSETRGIDKRQGSATRLPADVSDELQSRKAARSTPKSDDSWSTNSKRYRGLPRGSTHADYSE